VSRHGSSLVCAVDGLSKIGTAAIGLPPIGPKLGQSPSHYSEVLTLLPSGSVIRRE